MQSRAIIHRLESWIASDIEKDLIKDKYGNKWKNILKSMTGTLTLHWFFPCVYIFLNYLLITAKNMDISSTLTKLTFHDYTLKMWDQI